MMEERSVIVIDDLFITDVDIDVCARATAQVAGLLCESSRLATLELYVGIQEASLPRAFGGVRSDRTGTGEQVLYVHRTERGVDLQKVSVEVMMSD
jgi:hypothetical protein